ncbi:hypothetical protein CBR_g5593 [Chara braunii]|uniref:CCHC-type domain-containing protein n=1 Tax=Chara braunii TaxID=69332 RepID=A0A388JRL4_CHABU|nr:hypothetical protein CBR_g5593 [Chara braunii]|eukprot:GBG60417.1 hypothetical protein CBR_g5593 [Chara braunii]
MGSPNLAENDSLGDERRNDIQELARLIRQTTTSHEKFKKIKVPLFDGENVTDWLEKYELNAHVRQWTECKMLEVVKRYVHVDLAEEVGEMACRTRIWKTLCERMLEKYQLGDGLLGVSDLRKVSRQKFGTIEGFLKRFEKVAKRVPDLSNKTKCIIFLTNFTEVEQRELIKGFTTRYDWDKIKENLKVGDFDQMLYHLQRRQRKMQEEELVSCDKDKEMFEAIIDVRMMMKEIRKEGLCGKELTVRQQDGKRKGKEREEESDEEGSEKEEEEEPPRKATKAERKVMNQTRGGQGTNGKQANYKSGHENDNCGTINQHQRQSQDTEPRQFRPQGGGGRGRGRGASGGRGYGKKDWNCNYCAQRGHGVRYCQTLAKDEEDRNVYMNIRGEVFDFKGNLIDSYIERGMRKEAFRRMNRTILGLDMERVWPCVPNMFLLGGHDGKRGVAPLAASLSALRAEGPSSSHLQTVPAGTRSVLNRPVLRRGTSPAVSQAQKIKKGVQPRVAPVVSAKAQQEAPVVIVEENLDTEDEKLRAEDERHARLRAQNRCLDENQDKEKDEGEEEEHQKKKNRYTIPIEEGIDIEKMVDRILESHRDFVTLKEFLAASSKIREELKQRLTRRKVMTVKLGEVIPPEANWTPAGAKWIGGVSRSAEEMGTWVADNTGAARRAASSSSRRRVATVATIMLFPSNTETRASAVAVAGFRQGWARVGRMVFHSADVFPTEVELKEDQGILEDPPRINAFVTTAMKLVLSVRVCPLRKTHRFNIGVVYDVLNKSIYRKFEDEIMWLSLCIMRNHHARQGPFIYIEHYDRG